MTSAYRYDDIGTVNAVKLIPKINSYNGYIQLYTELDSHIEVGDTVIISYSGDTAELGDLNLDNIYYVLQDDGFLYNNYAQGYNVLYVNKNTNSFVIDRFIYTLPANSKIYGHYVSTVSANNIIISSGEVDGTFMRNGTIEPTSNTDITQIVMLQGKIFDINKSDKYSTDYISLLLDYNETTNNYKKYSNINNNEYGYSYFYNVEIKDCNFYSGLYYDCDISASEPTNVIDGGYFSNCYIYNYEIFNGYMNNSTLEDCEWNYGRWDGGVFTLNTWQDGIFINGTFGNDNNAIWENGTFYNGVWVGLYWINGDFVGGQFKGQDNYENGEGQIVYTEWLSGNFIDGEMYNDDFYSNTGIGNSFYVKDIKISGGDVYNASIFGGSINGGNIYNSSIKNCNICDGNFISNLQNVDYKYNRISNCNIYGGNFVGEWWSPIYLESTSAFTGSTYGLNEISESTIYNGDFRYSHFYNFNEIKNGNFDSCLFLSPIDVRDGVFKNGKINYIKIFDGVSGYTITKSQKSNYFGTEKFNFSKASIRRKELLNSSEELVSKILLEFDNGHNFTDGDSGKTINLVGFKSQELWDSTYTILSSDTYYDPTTYNSPEAISQSNQLPYEYFEPVGETYIVLNEEYKEWFYNDSGIVRKVDYYDLLSEFNDSFYNIYNGKYSYCYMRGVEIPEQTAIDDNEIDTTLSITSTTYGNIKIHYGEFKTSYLQNGVVWFNGSFDGGLFVSDFGIGPENHWYGGNFYNGTFGDNSGGDLDTMTLSIWNDNAYIIDKSGTTGEQTNEWRLEKIYPLTHAKYNLYNLGFSVNPFFAGAFLPEMRTLTLTKYDNSYCINDYAKNTMNIEPWSEQRLSNITPYEFVFVVKCSDNSARMKLSLILNYLPSQSTYDKYIGLIDPDRKTMPVNSGNSEYIREPYKLFETLYTDNYDYKYVDYYEDSENRIYIRFRFNEIERLYANSTDSEFQHFNKNYRSVWSLANTGYYTHPMPVLYSDENDNYGYEDLTSVGQFIIYGSDGVNTDSGWIYGTCPPPWWYNVPVTSVPNINWYNANVGTITKISTKNDDTSITINNNNKPVEYFEITFNDILPRLKNSWIMKDLYGISNQDGQYTGEFRHIEGVTTANRSDIPIPYREKLVEWYRHYIYLNKNKTGFNCSPKIKYVSVHNEQNSKQLLYDPYFNNVEDYKTEPIWDLGGVQEGRVFKTKSEFTRPSMIYNTKAYYGNLIGNKLYFNNNVNFDDRNEENLFNFSDFDTTIRVTERTIPTQLDFNVDNDEITENVYFDLSNIGFGATQPPSPTSRYIFEDGVYDILGVSGYSYIDGQLQNYLILDVPYDDNFSRPVEIFPQNRGIIMPYFYKVQDSNIQTITDVNNDVATIINYKNYGPKLALKMDPIFHNYAFNGKSSFGMGLVSAATFNNRNIFGVRIIKLIPDNGDIIKNNKYRIIFNSLYENAEQILEYIGASSVSEPLVGAYSFYDSNNLPDFNAPSYFVDPVDLLQSLRYSDVSDNWISISNPVPQTYNDNLTNDIFTGTWKVTNSGLTGTGDTGYYGTIISSAGGSVVYDDTDPDRVYFDIEGLDMNNSLYPTLTLSDDTSLESIWGSDYQSLTPSLLTNNVLYYRMVNSSENYVRFSTGFNPYVYFDESIDTIVDSISGGSTSTETRDDLSYNEAALSSYTDFRIFYTDPTTPTIVPDEPKISKRSIRFPDEEVTINEITRKTGAIWINNPGAWEYHASMMDRHYRLKIKLVKRKLYLTEPVVLDETGTTISVIFGDRIFTKTGADFVTGNTTLPTIEFEIYHHLIKGEEWSNKFIGVVLENAEFSVSGDCMNEYYITEMTLDYDPCNYVDTFATLEPEVECAGRIVKLRTKYREILGIEINNTQTTYKTISTKILDYDWLNKSYIFDINAVDSDLGKFNDVYLATNMRSYNIFDFPKINTSIIYEGGAVGYTGTAKWCLPSWSTNTNPTISTTVGRETIYQKQKGNNFSKKDCMMEIRYLTSYNYIDGSGAYTGNETYHDSMGDSPINNPVDYSILGVNGDVKQTQMSLINLTDYDNLGKEYFDYGVLNTYKTSHVGLDIGAGAGAFSTSIDERLLHRDNVDYWFGPLISYFGATVKNSTIEDSEHPAYWTGCFYQRVGGPTTIVGTYSAETIMYDDYSDENYDYTYRYYRNYDGYNVSDSDMYDFNNGKSPCNMSNLRGWKHIGRCMSKDLDDYWVQGAYEGACQLQGNYVDLFKTNPMTDSELEPINPNDTVAIHINQPNVYNIYTRTGSNDKNFRTVIKCARIVEKVDIENFDLIDDTLSDEVTTVDYVDYRIDGFDGMEKFGLEMWKHNNTFRIMSHNYLINYPDDYNPQYNVVWYYDVEDFTKKHNFHDIALFNAYHIGKEENNEYQNVLFNNQTDYDFEESDANMMYNMFDDMENGNQTYNDQYSPYFTDEINKKFRDMNEEDQTSVQNFNKKSGIQIHTVNVGITPDTYVDNWYDGTFYDGIFEGKWYDGQWINGQWIGYNVLAAANSGESDYYVDIFLSQITSPDFVNIGFVEKETYDVNYDLLKKKKLYYDISPWDDASKKNNEVVKLPLSKKQRKNK